MITFAIIRLLSRVKRPLIEMLTLNSARVVLGVLSVAILLSVLSPSTIAAQSDDGGSTISAVMVNEITHSSATITWTTSQTSSGLVIFGTNRGSASSRVFNPALSVNHAEQLTGLTPDTRYFFRLQEVLVDDGGLDSAGALYSFSTLEAPEVQRAFVGVVTSERGDSFTLNQQGTVQVVTILLPEEVALSTSPRSGGGVFRPGARVVVLSHLVEEKWVARRLIVKPSKAAVPITGVIVAAEEGTVRLTSPDGTTRALDLSALREEVRVGDLVTILPGPSGQARGLVKAAQLRERLTNFLVDIAASEIKNGEDGFQAQHAARLIRILDQQISRQKQIIDNVLRHAPQEIKGAISETKEEIEIYTLDSQRIKVRVRAKFGLEEEAPSQGQGSRQDNQGQGQGSGESGQGSRQDNQGQGNGDSGQGSRQDNQGQGNGDSGQGSGQDNQGQGSPPPR